MRILVNVSNRTLALIGRLSAEKGISVEEFCVNIFFNVAGCNNPSGRISSSIASSLRRFAHGGAGGRKLVCPLCLVTGDSPEMREALSQ